jgi:hypothetical protein
MTSESDPRSPTYWQSLDEQYRAKEKEQERLERILLEGRWVSAQQALEIAMKSGDTRDDAAEFLRAMAAGERKQRPALRVRARTAEAQDTIGNRTMRRDRIVHGYEWDGEVVRSHWGSGTFVLKTKQILGRTLTLSSAEFSLDDLESLFTDQAPTAQPCVEDRSSKDDAVKNEMPVKQERPRGRPKGRGYQDADIPALIAMRILIEKQGKLITTAAKEVGRDLHPKSTIEHWERYRRAYPKWIRGMDDKTSD